MYGISGSLAVNTNGYANSLFIENHHLSLTTFSIYNSGGNGLVYTVWGHLDDSGPPYTEPTFDGTWVQIPSTTYEITVPAGESRAETLTDNFAWILIRFKRETTGQDTTAIVRMRSRQSRY